MTKKYLGLPYQGSKRKLAPELLGAMMQRQPEAANFVDLFGGGGAMSFAAQQTGKFERVIYNELNSAVVALLRKLMADGVTAEFYEWIAREQFFELIKGNDWLAGLAQTCWSFGNNGRTYLYGRKIEAKKKELHDLIVTGTPIEQIQSRRLEVMRGYRKKHGHYQLQHLEHLQHLERLGHLELNNLDYRQVSIPPNSIVYCDIPYEKTGGYVVGSFDFEAFYTWAATCGHTVYVSSYESPLPCVHEMAHRSMMGRNDKRTTEKLFVSEASNANLH